jgi:hypothetical protein
MGPASGESDGPAGPAQPGDAPGRPHPPLAGTGGGSPGKPEDEAVARITPTLPAAPATAPRKPLALRPARISGDRDWVIFVECRPDAVVLYPSRKTFALTDLARTQGPNPLLQAIQAMIDRRQSGVRPGDAMFRPQVRFLVRPDSLRTFHTAYPALDALAVPKTRQNLQPEDDAAAIAAGQ